MTSSASAVSFYVKTNTRDQSSVRMPRPSGRLTHIYIYIYIYVCVCVCVCINIYIYRIYIYYKRKEYVALKNAVSIKRCPHSVLVICKSFDL